MCFSTGGCSYQGNRTLPSHRKFGYVTLFPGVFLKAKSDWTHISLCPVNTAGLSFSLSADYLQILPCRNLCFWLWICFLCTSHPRCLHSRRWGLAPFTSTRTEPNKVAGRWQPDQMKEKQEPVVCCPAHCVDDKLGLSCRSWTHTLALQYNSHSCLCKHISPNTPFSVVFSGS